MEGFLLEGLVLEELVLKELLLKELLLKELLCLEQYLKDIDCWDQQPPPVEALMSSMPFCIDTLEFPQWVQFIFIVRMRAIIDEGMPLPQECEIAPMAEEYFNSRNTIDKNTLKKIIQSFNKIEKLLTI